MTRATSLLLALATACSSADGTATDASARDAAPIAGDAAPRADAAARDAAPAPDDAMPAADAAIADDDAAVTTDGGTDVCPLDPEGRALVANVLTTLVTEISVVTQHVSPAEAAFVVALPATTISFANFAFLLGPCTAPETFVPYCTIGEGGMAEAEGYYAKHDMCSRLGCEADGIYLAEMWLTMLPIVDPAQTHPFYFDTELPVGSAVADPNPHLTWRTDLRIPNEPHVSANLDWKLTITSSATGNVLVADFDAQARGERKLNAAGDPITAVRIDATFPALGSVPLTTTASVGFNHLTGGEIRTPTGLIGTVVATSTAIAIDWLGACR